MKKTITIGLATATLAAAGLAAALAQDGPGADREDRRAMMQAEIGNRIAEVDGNGDGAISREEADARRAADFAAADTDGSGGLSQAEAQAWHEAKQAERKARRAEAMFNRADADGDGAIGPDEFGQRQDRMFERMDANGDGTISQDEIEDGLREMGRKHRGHRNGRRDER